MTQCKRLHVSPLNSEILPTILPGPLLDKASNISFHAIETFPEKNYGYLELPQPEADKLRRKLNGSTLRGIKMRVEEARPKKSLKEKKAQTDEASDIKKPKQNKRKAKEDGVIPGHELQDRKVKRGWTEPSSESKPSNRHKDKSEKKSKAKSSTLTGEAECLFKTALPPNSTSSRDAKDSKVKKRKRGEPGLDVVVHEFSNNTKHASFLRDGSGIEGKKPASEYLEGKGWVDEDGNIVEAGPKRRRSKALPVDGSKHNVEHITRSRSRRASGLDVPSVEVTAPKSSRAATAVTEDETSSSGASSSDNESNLSAPEPSSTPVQQLGSPSHHKTGTKSASIRAHRQNEVEVDHIERLSITRSSATPPPSQERAPTSAPATKGIHPLEALFKRPNTAASHTPKKPNLEVTTSFSFFDPETEESESQGLLMPQTPFTQQDIRQRRQRSAAPTPDTAAPGKTFGDVWEGTSDIDGDSEEDAIPRSNDNTSTTPEIKEEKPESDFSKWFWEHRGENNRAWKRKRREAAKEKRQKENKERSG